MDHPFEIGEILAAYFGALPGDVRRHFSKDGEADPARLAARWEKRLVGDEVVDIVDSFAYYRALMATGRDRANVLSYNEPAASVYPFVVGRVFDAFGDGTKKALLSGAGAADGTALARAMAASISLRNAFRRAFSESVNGPILSFLYSMVYLMGFSSGGEASFLSRVLPRVGNWEGRVLDAGGGSGFAGLILSSRGPVTYVDFSPFRASRAAAIAAASRKDPAFFSEMLDLIDEESRVFNLVLDRALIPAEFPHEVTYGAADLAHLPADLGPFDGAILTDVLEHTADPQGVLASVARTLKNGARLLVTVPTDANGIAGRIREEEEGYTFPFLLHIEFFSDERIERMAQKAGLAVEELAYFSYEKTSCIGPAPMEVMGILRKK
jgi:SAM-dependent methyltransferase